MIRKLTIPLITITTLLLLSLSCAPPELEPTTTPEPKIPAHFTTYTSEGLFSISYPPDWVPATSIMGEVFEATKEWMESIDPEASLEGISMLFMAGILTEEGYYPGVNIIVMPRSVGFWTLDEIVETDSAWCRENLLKYREYSLLNTTIGGREAAISDWEDYDPDMGTWRYITAYLVKDKFVWLVGCGAESEDFKDYEDAFSDIVRSLRILN